MSRGLITRDELRPDVRLLAPSLVCWAAVAVLLPAPTPVVLGVVGGALLLAAGAWPTGRRWGGARSVCATGLLVALVLVAALGHRGVERAGSVAALAEDRAVVHVEATVTADPRRVGGGAERAEKALLLLTVHEVTGRGARSTVSTPVVAFADPREATVRLHDRVRASGRLAPPQPGGDVAATLSIHGPLQVVAGAGVVDRAAEHVRHRFRQAVDGLPDDARGLVPALVIGDTSRTPEDLTAAMKQTSLTHLSAVSGSNVSVVLGAMLWLCGLVGLPRRGRAAVALLGLAGFVVLARPEPSVIRAAVMGAVGLVAVSTHRERRGTAALGAAIVLLLLLDPWLARSFGFALSCLATLGLLLFARPWGHALERHLPRWCSGLGPPLAIPVAAQVMCAPVTLLLQPGVSLVGIPANLVAEPFVGPATTAGVVTALVAVACLPLARLLAWVAALPTLAIAQVARHGATVPFGTLPWPDGPTGVLALVAVTLVVVLCGRRLAWETTLRPFLAVGLLLLLAAATVPVGSVAWPTPGWTVVSCDVGEGDATVLRSGPDRAVLVDVGPDAEHVAACLDGLGVRTIDALVLTHFHADHVTGLDRVLDSREVRALYITLADDPPDQATRVTRLAVAHGLRPERLRAGARVEAGDVRADVLWPARVLSEGSVPNNASIVLLADVAGTRVLVTGDIEREAAHEVLLELRRRRPALDVLRVAHHGSSNQDPQLVAEAGAPLAVISVGADNDYGHPSPLTLRALRLAGPTIVRTDECGDIAVIGHGDSLRYACRRR